MNEETKNRELIFLLKEIVTHQKQLAEYLQLSDNQRIIIKKLEEQLKELES